jgi:flagellar biosynthesis repressor protein FlbT
MTGLVLKLAPNERLLINGAVIENGNRRSRLNILTPAANILRLKDAIHPDEANTPIRRLCYQAQLALTGDATLDTVGPEIVAGIEELAKILRDPESHAMLSAARHAVEEGRPYYVLKFLRRLLDTEEALLKMARA